MSSYTIQVISKTWSKDSYSLFDYESKSFTLKHLSVSSSSTLLRRDSSVSLSKTKNNLPKDSSFLHRLELNRGAYYLCPAPSGSLWMVLRYMKSPHLKGYILREGSHLRFGRVTLTILKLRGISYPSSCSPSPLVQQSSCRICMGEESDYDDPLLSPCACSGSLKFIHLKCLRRWIESRRVEEEGSAYWKSIDCEICKTRFPLTITNGHRSFDLIQPGDGPFILFEYTVKDSFYGGVRAVCFEDKKSVKIGRGTDSDVRISDISVSRVHALIHFENGEFYVEDNNSKFGSLIKVNGPIKIESKKPLHLQEGRTILSYSVCQNPGS